MVTPQSHVLSNLYNYLDVYQHKGSYNRHFDNFSHYNNHPFYEVNPPTFVATGAQIDLIVQAGLLQARYKHVYVWMTTTYHGQS